MFKRTFARTLPDNLKAPHMKMQGFEAKRARKITRTLPRTLPWNFITMLSAPLILLHSEWNKDLQLNHDDCGVPRRHAEGRASKTPVTLQVETNPCDEGLFFKVLQTRITIRKFC